MKTIEQLGTSPAPWKRGELVPFCEENVVRCSYIREDGSGSDRVVASCNAKFSDEYARKDARLIAAAPELYEALRLCIHELCEECRQNTVRPCVDMCETVRIARAALEKAGGVE